MTGRDVPRSQNGFPAFLCFSPNLAKKISRASEQRQKLVKPHKRGKGSPFIAALDVPSSKGD